MFVMSGLFLYIFTYRITRLMNRKKYLGLSIYDRDWVYIIGIRYIEEELTVCNVGIKYLWPGLAIYDRDWVFLYMTGIENIIYKCQDWVYIVGIEYIWSGLSIYDRDWVYKRGIDCIYDRDWVYYIGIDYLWPGLGI